MALLDPTRLSAAIFDVLTGDARAGFAAPMTDRQKDMIRAWTDAIAQEVVDEVEPHLEQPGGGGATVHNDLTGRELPGCHPVAAITGLQEQLLGKASAGDVTSMQEQLAGKASLEDVSTLQAALQEKANVGDVSGLMEQLAGKASLDDISALQTAIAGKASTGDVVLLAETVGLHGVRLSAVEARSFERGPRVRAEYEWDPAEEGYKLKSARDPDGVLPELATRNETGVAKIVFKTTLPTATPSVLPAAGPSLAGRAAFASVRSRSAFDVILDFSTLEGAACLAWFSLVIDYEAP